MTPNLRHSASVFNKNYSKQNSMFIEAPEH